MTTIRLTSWEVRRLLEALESGSQRAEDHDLWLKLHKAAKRLSRREMAKLLGDE
jgi:hypothetical protein